MRKISTGKKDNEASASSPSPAPGLSPRNINDLFKIMSLKNSETSPDKMKVVEKVVDTLYPTDIKLLWMVSSLDHRTQAALWRINVRQAILKCSDPDCTELNGLDYYDVAVETILRSRVSSNRGGRNDARDIATSGFLPEPDSQRKNMFSRILGGVKQ